MGELSEALGKGREVEFGGRTLLVEPLDFNDLSELEDRTGINADDINIEEFLKPIKNRRFFLWLVLRKADPTLSDEARERGQYRLTEEDAGRQIKFGTTPEQYALIYTALGISGLKADSEEDAEVPKTQPAEEAPVTQPTKKRASAPSA